MALGQTDGGNAEKPVGDNGLVQVASVSAGPRCTIGCQRLLYRESIRRNSSGQNVLVDVIDYAIGNHEQPLFLAIGSDQHLDVRASPGSDAINWARGKYVPVDHRLEGHQVARHLAPARRVGMLKNI